MSVGVLGLSEQAAGDRAAVLAALDVLDGPPEPEYDDVVHLAALICETPVALVSLVGRERQWFKARVGFEACETSLDQSVCVHALADPAPGIFTIPDLTLDPRTRDNPLVTGPPHLRFYAGARLAMPDGTAIGTLCVLDRQPRPDGLLPAQATALVALGNQVISLLALRKASMELIERKRVDAARAHHERDEDRLARQSSETRYRTLLENIDQGFCVIEFLDGPEGPLSDYRHIEGNAAFAEHTGLPDAMGKRLRELVGAEADVWARRYGEVLRTGRPVHFEQELVETGRFLTVAAHRIEPATLRQVAILFSDITARKQAEITLRDAKHSLEQQVVERTAELRLYGDIVRSSAAPICAFDTEFRLIAFNQAHSDEFYRIFGYHVELGEVFPDRFPPEQASIMRGFMARALTGEAYTVTEGFGDPALVKPYWEVAYSPLRDPDGRVIGAFHFAKDITSRLRAEADLATTQEALRQAQKMEAVGQLTGGLAHDFNNLLAGISGSLELMQSRVQQGRLGDVDKYVVAAQGAAKRAAALTHRLLAFSRRQTLAPRPTDVNRLVLDMQDMIQRTVGPAVTVEVVGASDLWAALVDPSQLENALLNLCINARDAMPDGGRITVETANRWLDERAARQQDMPEGQYLALNVTDTGTGMPPEVIARVFEPFFTTKPLGEGTGLGLSMIYGFAQQSGGQVRIQSEIGQGSTVCIYLPRHYGMAADEEGKNEPATLSRSGQGATVLIVDDEPTVRMLVTDILEDLGYTAIEAGDSMAGLKILQSDVRIDLLVTDVGLPGGMNGRQMADAGRVRRPGLRVLFITGYAENAILGHGHFAPGMTVLTKPFAMDAMAARILSLIETSKETDQPDRPL